MKFLRPATAVLIVILVAFILFRGCSYLDLQVSEKYETQMQGITDTPEALRKAEIKAIEINKDRKSIRWQVIVASSSTVIVVICYSLIRKRLMQVN
ncbi:MAG: hypothetical protein V4616_04665 [Bacteroidota bacterium]